MQKIRDRPRCRSSGIEDALNRPLHRLAGSIEPCLLGQRINHT
jgi:hypothetical protein